MGIVPKDGLCGLSLSYDSRKLPSSPFLPLVHPTQVSKDDRSDVESSSEEEDVTTSTKSPRGGNSSNGANRVNGHMGGSYWAEE